MNLIDLLQMTKPQAAQQQSEGLGPIMQFLAQSRAPQMPAIQMPQGSNYGQQILAHGLQKQDREDTYAAHLQAKNDMEQQQAEHWKGSGAQLSSDPSIQALIDSGDAQKAAYGLKLAEEEAQKKIASQYNENATFALYDKLVQEGTPESLAKAARIMEFKKAGGTNINLGQLDKPIPIADLGMLSNPSGEHPLPGSSLSDLKGTDYRVVDSADQEDTRTLTTALSVINEMERQANELYKDPRWNKPKQEGLVNQLVDKAKTTLESNSEVYLQNDPRYKAYEDFVNANAGLIARGLSGEKGAMAEGDIQRAKAKLVTLTGINPDMPDVGKSKIADLRRSLEARLSTMAQKQLGGSSSISQVIDAKPGYNVVQTPEGDVVKQEGQRAWRNNNPGNIEYGPFAEKNGAIGSDGRFAIFPSKEHGANAQSDLLFNSDGYKNLTLTDAISKYAPSFENNTPAYQKNILNAVGGVNKVMSQYTDAERNAILGAMHIVEGNKQGKSTVLKISEHPLAKQAIDVKKNSPIERTKNDARRAALEARANKLRAAQ